MSSGLNIFLFLLLLIPVGLPAQPPVTTKDSITVVAGTEYKKGMFHRFFWGKNRRLEWTTPVRVPIVQLDSFGGGLTGYKPGGGNESKTLRLRSAAGKEYVIRSINKSREAVTPKLLRGTYFGMVIQDGVSMSYPYGALAIPLMMKAAGIYHSDPKLVYINQQKALGDFNAKFADDLYLLEERPEGDWSDAAPHLGSFKDYFSTKKVIEKTLSNGNTKTDQKLFIRSRLFDVIIADWDRNHDNWRWGAIVTKEGTTYVPVARDRDQAFFTRSGLLMRLLMPLMRVSFMQNFGDRVKNVGKQTKQDRKLDELLTNEMTLTDWQREAAYLQQSLTDSIIRLSVAQIPPEIFSVSGEELVSKLISRRNKLAEYATEFYYVLAKHVHVNATTGRDWISIKKTGADLITVALFSIGANGNKSATPYYLRVFRSSETKQITVNGWGGDDVVEQDADIRSIKVVASKDPSIIKL